MVGRPRVGTGPLPGLRLSHSAVPVPRVGRGDRAPATGAACATDPGRFHSPRLRRRRAGPRWDRDRRQRTEFFLFAAVVQRHGGGIPGEPILPGRRSGHRGGDGPRLRHRQLRARPLLRGRGVAAADVIPSASLRRPRCAPTSLRVTYGGRAVSILGRYAADRLRGRPYPAVRHGSETRRSGRCVAQGR